MEEAKLTIPKGYDPNDAKAAEGMARGCLPEEALLLVERSRSEVPAVPRLEYMGAVASGVDNFYAIAEAE